MKVKMIKGQLKKLFPALLVIHLSMNMMGCSHGKVKREIEVWLIDNDEMLLFRVLKGNKEQIIPLRSKSMDRFICIDKDEAKGIIGQIIEED